VGTIAGVRWLASVALVAAAGLLALASPAGAILPGPNGKIVLTSGRDDGATVLDDAHAQLWVAAKPGATPVRVTADTTIQHRHASWSPDRTKLVYSAGDAVTKDFDIWIFDLTKPISPGTNPRNITQSPGVSEDRPSWSPDGTRVAYQSKLLSSSSLPATIITERVTDPMFTTVLSQPMGTGDAGKPVWTNDSKTLYYSLVVNPGTMPADDDIYRQPADGTGTATPVITGSTDDYQPALSPNGQSLCYTSGAFGTPAAKVMRATVTGTNVITIANTGVGDYNCAWSPDGTKIAYVEGIFGNGSLMFKNSDGTGMGTDLVPNVPARFDGNPEWTRNPPPNCQSRSVTVSRNASIAMPIPLTCVDPPPENDPVTLSLASLPVHGTLGTITGGVVTYVPNANFEGIDQFTFTGDDGTSDSAPATIQITVKGPPPAISALKVAPRRWRLGSRQPHISRTPVGTRISFKLSKPARVTLTFDRVASGRRVRGRCVASTRSNRTKPRCTRVVDSHALRFNGHSGTNTVAFQGRINSTKLKPGDYRLSVGATDATGGRARAQTATFILVPR
jgi:Bacterial Ig domain/WD40-like Beta Propeller Repeat